MDRETEIDATVGRGADCGKAAIIRCLETGNSLFSAVSAGRKNRWNHRGLWHKRKRTQNVRRWQVARDSLECHPVGRRVGNGMTQAERALDGMTGPMRARLAARIDTIPLFAHAYAWHLNFRFGDASPVDLLHDAASRGLFGVKIHVEDGETRSLLHATPAARARFGAVARDLGLRVHVETSSTDVADLRAAIAVALDTGAESVRTYPRHAGRVSEILRRSVADLRQLPALDPDGRLDFLLEQHEDLTSTELMRLLAQVGNPRLTLLYDFGNMINAYERPEAALAVMAPKITDVHIKDVVILEDRGGWAHRACRSGEGDIDFHDLLAQLLLLGEAAPQVRAFALEEENEMIAPAYRFPDEAADPLIPPREASTTLLPPGEALADRLARERDEAAAQLAYVRGVLAELKQAAARITAPAADTGADR